MRSARLARVPLLVAALAMPMAGCDRRVEPWVEPEDEPPAPEQAVRIPGLGRPAPAPFAPAPAAAAPAARGTAASTAPPVQGVLRLGPGATLPAGGVLFVIARSGGGPPLAVRRLPPGPFPLEFAIGPEHVMMQGRPFEGPLSISARVDTDGDPLTRAPTDLLAAASGAVEPGASGLELVLLPAASSSP